MPLVALLATGVGRGCAAGGARTADRTGGLTVELLDEPERGAFSLYRVERDGTLRFGGGVDALNERFSWSGPLTIEEIARLRQLNDEHRWVERRSRPTDSASPRRSTLSVRDGSKYRRYRIEGECDGITPLRELLEQASQRRLDDFMRRLPQPGLQQDR
jgi:hypothetical protein